MCATASSNGRRAPSGTRSRRSAGRTACAQLVRPLGDQDPLRLPWFERARKALGRALRGTEAGTPRPAWAVPAEHVALIVAAATRERDRHVAADDLERALAASRDAAWYALSFMACLRKSEANSLTRKKV